LISGFLLIWQSGRQHKNSLKQQRENARQALKLQIYETVLTKIRAASEARLNAATYVRLLKSALEGAARAASVRQSSSPLKQRVPEFVRLDGEAHNGIAELLIEFESWTIAFPGIKVFIIAFNAAAHDAREAFPPLFSALVPILPMDAPPGASVPAEFPLPIIHPLPQPERLAIVYELIDRYIAALDQIESYLGDLTTEAQNILLHGLFDQPVPLRQPLDPRLKVISMAPDKAEALIRYFEKESPWGKHVAAINASVIEEIRKRDQRS
jgi:hypothetical protein